MADTISSPPEQKYFPLTRKLVSFLVEEGRAMCHTIGLATLNTLAVGRFLWERRLSRKHFFQQAAFVGVDTLGISLVLVTFSGMVIALQIAKEMAKQGAGNYIGALVSMAILREIAPVMTGVAVISMAGSAFAAEMSTMQITRQIDALRVLHVNPIRYLVLPRVVAATAMLPLITIITAFSGIMGGMVVSCLLADIHMGAYLDSVWHQIGVKDIASTILKAGVFGFLIAILSLTIGINTTGGAKEVGIATTRSVVWSFVACAVMDYVLSYLIYGN